MPRHSRQSRRRTFPAWLVGCAWLVIAAAAWFVLSAMPIPATAAAAPSSATGLSATIRAKQAQASAAEAQLSQMRSDLASGYAAFDRVTADLESLRQDLTITRDRLAELDAQVSEGQARLDARAVDIYKSGEFDELEVLLGTRSMQDLLDRMDLIVLIQDNDSRLLEGVVMARAESEGLKVQQEKRESDLSVLRQEAEARKLQIESAVARQDTLLRSLTADISLLVRQQEEAAAAAAAAAAEAGWTGGGTKPPVPFAPNTVISDAKFLAAGSMSAEAIQGFLNAQSGDLKDYVGADHNGARKSAAAMIAEACVYHGVSPKVILATLQKEQSLISRPSPSQYALDWALGCGKAESYTIDRYKGFGNQIWEGARVMIKNRAGWRSGIALAIDHAAVYPSNASTHSLYRYTPHFAGATSFWRLYWGYFGDPVS